MKYYMGDIFSKEDCKEYKTLEGGLKAAQKANTNLYDENGDIVHEATAKPEASAQKAQEAAQAENAAPEAEKEQEGAKTETTAPSEADGTSDGENSPDAATATMTNDVPDGADATAEDGSMKTYDADGNEVGTVTAKEVEQAMDAVTEIIEGIPAVRVSGRIRRVFDGNIRIRNHPSMDAGAVRGVSRFNEKNVTHVLDVDGEPMYRTTDGYFVTGNPAIVEYIPE